MGFLKFAASGLLVGIYLLAMLLPMLVPNTAIVPGASLVWLVFTHPVGVALCVLLAFLTLKLAVRY